MRLIKEFILHHQGYERHVLGCEVMSCVSLSSVVGCCSGIFLLSALHWRGLLTVPQQQKTKQQSCVEPLHSPAASSYGHLLNPSSLPRKIIPPWQILRNVCNILTTTTQLTTQKPDMHTNHPLCLHVATRVGINTSHQQSVGKHLVTAINKVHAARDFWQETNSPCSDVLEAFPVTSFILDP